MHEKIRGWIVTDIDDPSGPVVKIEKKGRPPLLIAYQDGMDRAVLLEFATTRVLEAELANAGAHAPAVLQRDYDEHVAASRDNQELRSRKRLRAEQRDEEG